MERGGNRGRVEGRWWEEKRDGDRKGGGRGEEIGREGGREEWRGGGRE